MTAVRGATPATQRQRHRHRRRSHRGLIVPLVAAMLMLVVGVLGFVLAITGGQLGCSGPGGPAPTRTALTGIPPARLVLYQAAARRFDIDWAFLASVGAQECNHGSCAGDNSSGCAGPMQIADLPGSPCSPGSGPTEWDRWHVDGNGDGRLDVNDPADAIFTAARILRFDKAAPATGGSYTAYRQAACRYYGACADPSANYADEVMTRAVQYGFRGAGAPSATTAPATGQPANQATGSGQQCGGAGSPDGGSASGSMIVRVAVSQLGNGERPPGSNCTRYGPCEEWCALFAAWSWQHAGVQMTGGTAPYAYSGSLYTWARDHGGRVLAPTAQPAPGDAVLYGSGPADSVHVGLVERVFPDGEITTIEGNSGNAVRRSGPFQPAGALAAGEPGPIYGYARPPVGASAATGS
jgi:hypothetical protein